MDLPLITIFVRHSADCKYEGDEFCKRCKCKKHLRWSKGGKQYRRKTGQRSWAGAEEVKRDTEAQLTGRAPALPVESGLLLSQAVDTFKANKEAQGITLASRTAYALLLTRLVTFSKRRGLFGVKQSLTLDNLTAFRATWSEQLDSSYSRAVQQKRLNHFLRFCYNAQWLERVPKLSPIKIDQPETAPLTDAEYEEVLKAAATERTRTLIKLMRWSGLAVRDASTLKRADLHFDKKKGLYRIIRKRTKTGEPLYVPIPKDVAEDLVRLTNDNPAYVFWNRRKDSSGQPFSCYMGKQVSEAFTVAGVDSEGHMVSHRLRATFAVDLLTKGLPLEHVSKLLGHRSVTTTERHYAKWVKGRQDRLDALVSATWRH